MVQEEEDKAPEVAAKAEAAVKVVKEVATTAALIVPASVDAILPNVVVMEGETIRTALFNNVMAKTGAVNVKTISVMNRTDAPNGVVRVIHRVVLRWKNVSVENRSTSVTRPVRRLVDQGLVEIYVNGVQGAVTVAVSVNVLAPTIPIAVRTPSPVNVTENNQQNVAKWIAHSQ